MFNARDMDFHGFCQQTKRQRKVTNADDSSQWFVQCQDCNVYCLLCEKRVTEDHLLCSKHTRRSKDAGWWLNPYMSR